MSGDEGTVLNDVSEGPDEELATEVNDGIERLFVHSFQGFVVVEAKVTGVDDVLCVESLGHGIDLREFACTYGSDRAVEIGKGGGL